MNNPRKYCGFLMTEVVTTLALVALLAALVASAMHFYGFVNRVQLVRRHCLSAAQAQMDSLMVQKQALSAEEIQRLWPGVVCTLEKHPGQGTWEKLDLYTVTATAKVRSREVSVRMKRYIQRGEQ